MIETAVIALRLFQYASGSILMGSALFAIYALDGERSPWMRPLLMGGAMTLFITALLSFIAQTALLAGSWTAALTRESLEAMLTIGVGKAALWRAGFAALAVVILIASQPRGMLWMAIATLGTIAVATFGWMGHGAASASWTQLLADIAHVLAAASWIGALTAFLFLVRSAVRPTQVFKLERALRRFSTLGILLVATLAASGLVNGWYLVGAGHVTTVLTTDYGRLLFLKLVLFAGMLVLAALNRSRYAPAIERTPNDPETVRAFRRSISIEFALGLGVLAAVAWLGTLAPPAEF